MKNINIVNKHLNVKTVLVLMFCFLAFSTAFAQVEEPKPSAPKSVSIPAVKEKKLKNGLTIAVVERKNVPLVSVQMQISAGVYYEVLATAGLANMTANLLTKGTPTRSATQIAEEIEFLGGNIYTNANLETSNITINIASDKINQAMQVMSDVILRPTFPVKEINLAKSQALDELNYNLKQPGFLANYFASVYTFKGNPAGGTTESLKSLNKKEISEFYKDNYFPENATLIFVGDIDANKAFTISQNLFGNWKNPVKEKFIIGAEDVRAIAPTVEKKIDPTVKRFVVIDLPNSGQSAVLFAKDLNGIGRADWNDQTETDETSKAFFSAMVMNSILGGGYSSRLNQVIRIKRGLSYGAGSNFIWSSNESRFLARTQTKDVSAAEVADIIVAEIEKLNSDQFSEYEINSRKSVLTGNFGRDLETNSGLLDAVSELYSVGLYTKELNTFMKNVQSVSQEEIKNFSNEFLRGGDLIIAGDYAKFKDDLAKRFPNAKVEVIKAGTLDLKKIQTRY